MSFIFLVGSGAEFWSSKILTHLGMAKLDAGTAHAARAVQLLDAVKATGKCFIIHTKLSGRIAIRVACGGIEQTEADVTCAYEVIRAELARLLQLRRIIPRPCSRLPLEPALSTQPLLPGAPCMSRGGGCSGSG